MAAKDPKKAKASPPKQPVVIEGEVVPGSEGIEQGITIVNASDGEVAAGGEQSPLVDELVSCVLLTSLASVNQSWRCGDLYQDTAENVERLISLGMASPQKGE